MVSETSINATYKNVYSYMRNMRNTTDATCKTVGPDLPPPPGPAKIIPAFWLCMLGFVYWVLFCILIMFSLLQ